MVEGKAPRSGPLFLLDGMSLAFRAYFALPNTLTTTSGMVTNAVHGFVSMVSYIVREHQPSSLAVAFDLPGETFRDEMVADYKAGRSEAPNDLPPQFEMIREVMEALAIPVVEAPGFEADDVLATLATEARDRDCDVVVVTGDRDSFQLIEDPHIRVLYNRRGVSDYSLYDEAGIVERTGVPPSKYVLLASLRGDPSDNLPGIPGVGEKTAAKLLNAYGDLDGIFSHLGRADAQAAREPDQQRGPGPFECDHHSLGARRAARRPRRPAPTRRVGPAERRGGLRQVRAEEPVAHHGGALVGRGVRRRGGGQRRARRLRNGPDQGRQSATGRPAGPGAPDLRALHRRRCPGRRGRRGR